MCLHFQNERNFFFVESNIREKSGSEKSAQCFIYIIRWWKKNRQAKEQTRKKFPNRYCGWSNEPCSKCFSASIISPCLNRPLKTALCVVILFQSNMACTHTKNCWFSTKVYPFENFHFVLWVCFFALRTPWSFPFLCWNIFICVNFTYNLIMNINWFICRWDCFICPINVYALCCVWLFMLFANKKERIKNTRKKYQAYHQFFGSNIWYKTSIWF